jgi:hypothetical protein
MEQMEDYAEKARTIFELINKYRANPRELARHLERLKKYLDTSTNILSEPDKIQIQMVEGEEVFNEAINFLKNLRPLEPLQWEDALAASAQEHVDDIGPKGLLLYQSSDGTEPEDRITKYGRYVDSLGENIDFGPNDAIGVIVSLTLDDGEEERPHRDNLFKNEYKKIGIACGPHQTEFQMCVMDLAYDFIPKGQEQQNMNMNMKNQMNTQNDNAKYKNLKQNENVRNNEMNANQAVNHSPYVKISLDNEDNYKNYQAMDEEAKRREIMENKPIVNQSNNLGGNEIDQITQQVQVINANKKILKKEVEITTKITYTYEDGSTKEINEVKKHVFGPNQG